MQHGGDPGGQHSQPHRLYTPFLSSSPHLVTVGMVGMVGVEISFVNWYSHHVISLIISHSILFTSHCPALITSFLRNILLFDGDEGRKQLKHFLVKPSFSLKLDIKSWFSIFTRLYCLHYHISCIWSDTQVFLFPYEWSASHEKAPLFGW